MITFFHLNIKQVLLVILQKILGKKKGLIIVPPLNYLSNFWRSLEMHLISCMAELSLKWNEKCMLTAANNASNATFKITDTKFYVPVVTLSTEDNVKLSDQLSEGFKVPVYWNQYMVTNNRGVEIADTDTENFMREQFDTSCQEVKRLFVLAYDNTAGNNQVSVDSPKKYFLPRGEIENYNDEIDGRNFNDQPSNYLMEQYQQDKTMIIQLVDCFKNNYRLIAADLSK